MIKGMQAGLSVSFHPTKLAKSAVLNELHHYTCLIHVKHNITSEYFASHAYIMITREMWLQANLACSVKSDASMPYYTKLPHTKC